ncbi:sensor histidine kinase [Microbacterium sp. No. 7]|uniref:sensor histidine kinase n=1 Tax=Microbacterium sp. No. 7 TaxID=1714373 RepID=UPI0006D2B1D1|nr:sensor histidine kinase [Microbacterium sp. No. 7]ALJ21578.1 histidine kinase [Microbacterium sp. No. 7]
MTSPAPPPVRTPLRQHAGALAQLAAVGLVGTALFTILSVLLSVGVGTVVILGVGIPFLLAFLYTLWATAWLEHERVEGLYGFGVPRLRVRSSGRPGFGGWLRTLWQQFIDGQMWRGIASAAISTALGLVLLPTISWMISSIGLLFAPLTTDSRVHLFRTDLWVEPGWAIAVGALGLILGAALVVGIALLHAVLTRAILVPSREALLAEQARTAGVQREGAVRASEVERTRIERDLHDGVQPRLVSIAMTLGLAQQKIESDPGSARLLVDEAHTSTKAAITELRQLARGIHASVLDDRGLDAALSALAARSPIPVHLDVRLDARCSRTAEAAVYFAIAETLTNAAKHSRGTAARVTVRRRDEDGAALLWARIEDDGIGGAHMQPGGGLDGIASRVAAAGGAMRLDSPNGGPTSLEVSVPCAS